MRLQKKPQTTREVLQLTLSHCTIKSRSSPPASRRSPANGRVASGWTGSRGPFSFMAPAGGMEVQRPLEISKFGQSVGGGAGRACAKNTSSGPGRRLHTQSGQGGEAQGGGTSGAFAEPPRSPARSPCCARPRLPRACPPETGERRPPRACPPDTGERRPPCACPTVTGEQLKKLLPLWSGCPVTQYHLRMWTVSKCHLRR